LKGDNTEIFGAIYATSVCFKTSGIRWFGKWLKLVRILVNVCYIVTTIFHID